ncbi:DNA polymerase III subunit delta [Neorhizobium lilium]|uniref:DNA polymerase III subunit delta n=1 Tax=Neorhizobium lilium TaxID=2503024 RepID=A0A3S3TTU0_9HYPH|nr:DNA polymerase III subunit delta [Neorhizobium lilium]RWX74564.1 DNA polymerase III subunit delta [Neorhizobium lilium]
MAEIKSHEFDRFIKRGVELYKIFVIYGPDRGLVSERATAIAKTSGAAPDDPFAMLKLDSGDLSGDPGRLMDEVNALGLFGGTKLVWLRGAANEKPLLDAIQVLANGPPPANMLVVEAGDLKKGSGLRKIVEPAKNIAVIPCYADDARALQALIDAELEGENLKISPAARARLLELLGGDRIASRNEIRKLALYCRGTNVIDERHVEDIIGDASSVSADEAVDAVLNGDMPALHRALHKVLASKTPVFLVLQACLKQLQMLDLMRSEMDEKRLQTSQVMMTLGRHVHFKRKPIIEKALRDWSAASILRETERLQAAILQTRQRQSLEPSIALQALIATAAQSHRRG